MEIERRWFIYTLADPESNEIRYVGWSSNPRQRLNAHCSRARHKGTYKQHWIKKVLDIGGRPIQQIVECGEGDGWEEAERRWIAHFRSLNCRLTNLTDGGEGTPGYIPSAETRAKMSAAHKGRKQSPESIAKTAAALRGRKQSPSHVEKLAATRKGKAIPYATIAASKKTLGTKQSKEHIIKRTAALIGRPSSLRKFTDEEIIEIRYSSLSLRKLATIYGAGQTTIFNIKSYKKYQSVSSPSVNKPLETLKQ